MTEQFRSQPQPEHRKQNTPEAGAGPLGLPPPDPEQGGSKSPEGQPLPSVWDVLERDVRFGERYGKDHLTTQEYEEGEREQGEVKRLANEIRQKGTVRDRLILDLYSTVTLELGGLPAPLSYNIPLLREEFQQLRLKANRLSEEGLSEEIRKAKEDFERRAEASFYPPSPGAINI